MKLIVNAFFALVIMLAIPVLTRAESAPPLITIRFNQKNINYHDKLTYVVREAVKTKSSVVFEVVDVAPGSSAGLYGQQIVSDIENLGVPAAQIIMRSESGDVSNEEVRIFVR